MGSGSRKVDTELEAVAESDDVLTVFEECPGLEKELLAAAFLEEVDVCLLPLESMSAHRMTVALEKLNGLSPFEAVGICLRVLLPDGEE